MTESLVRRAERAGFKALVLTVDAPFFGRRIADIKNGFALPPHLRMANFVGLGDLETKAGDKKVLKALCKDTHFDMLFLSQSGGSGINNYVASLFDPTLSWKDVEWLRSFTRLPIVLKGILRSDDAERAVRAGAAAIVVSNHGARQVDGVPATIDVIADIRRAVGDKVEVRQIVFSCCCYFG